jgi:hypothetical protein
LEASERRRSPGSTPKRLEASERRSPGSAPRAAGRDPLRALWARSRVCSAAQARDGGISPCRRLPERSSARRRRSVQIAGPRARWRGGRGRGGCEARPRTVEEAASVGDGDGLLPARATRRGITEGDWRHLFFFFPRKTKKWSAAGNRGFRGFDHKRRIYFVASHVRHLA